MENFCTLVIFNRSSKAIVYWDDIFQPYSDIQLLLGRNPDYESNEIISWGNISEEDIRKFKLHGEDPDPDGLELFFEWKEKNSGIDYLPSIFVRGSDNVE